MFLFIFYHDQLQKSKVPCLLFPPSIFPSRQQVIPCWCFSTHSSMNALTCIHVKKCVIYKIKIIFCLCSATHFTHLKYCQCCHIESLFQPYAFGHFEMPLLTISDSINILQIIWRINYYTLIIVSPHASLRTIVNGLHFALHPFCFSLLWISFSDSMVT